MDGLDKDILLNLSDNCRVTYQEMAQKYNVSSNAIKKRVQKLQSLGVIEGYYVELSYAMVDGEACMIVVTTDGTEDENFINTIGSNPLVGTIGKLAGSIYNIIGLYQGSASLSNLGSFIRGQPSVRDVEIHPLMFNVGSKIEFSSIDKKVLRQLIIDPRMPISEIAKKSGLTSRTVKKTIDDLANFGAVNFGYYMNPSAGTGLVAMFRIHWDEKKSNLGEILGYLSQTFPEEYFVPLITATNPLIFAVFLTANAKRVQEINSIMRQKPEITTLIAYMGEPARLFPDIKKIRLKEIVSEAGMPI